MADQPVIKEVRFSNFKVLRSATLPLSPFTLLVGANGSGKSTALQGLWALRQERHMSYDEVRSSFAADGSAVEIEVEWRPPFSIPRTKLSWPRRGAHSLDHVRATSQQVSLLHTFVSGIESFSLDSKVIARSVALQPDMRLQQDGGHLAGVLDRIRDHQPERFAQINGELSRWIPEYDQILFETPQAGMRSIALRTRQGGHRVKAGDVSDGALLSLAILTLAYSPRPPTLLCLEEPDRGIHPRLLRELRDALYRLSYPADFGEARDPVQVVATTHSPYFLDLFRKHPEEVVIAERSPTGASFQKLSDREDLEEILGDAHLGDVWYSGILGGVPAEE